MRIFRKSRRGSNAIEFAITLPVFLYVIMGIVDYGFLFASQAGLDNAVSMGCREGAMQDGVNTLPPATVASQEINARAAMFCPSGCAINVTLQSSAPNRTLNCLITRNMQPLVGMVPYPAQISSRSLYRLEWQRNN